MDKEIAIIVIPFLFAMFAFPSIMIYAHSKKKMMRFEDIKPENTNNYFLIKKASGAKYEMLFLIGIGVLCLYIFTVSMLGNEMGYIERVCALSHESFILVIFPLIGIVLVCKGIFSIVTARSLTLEIKDEEISIYKNKRIIQAFNIKNISKVKFYTHRGGYRRPKDSYLIYLSIFEEQNKIIIDEYPISAQVFMTLSSYFLSNNCTVEKDLQGIDASYIE